MIHAGWFVRRRFKELWLDKSKKQFIQVVWYDETSIIRQMTNII